MIFLTVGSALPFDRLVRMVDQAVGAGALAEEVFAQIGAGTYQPRHMRWVRMLPAAEFAATVDGCSAIISHAGIGTITTAVENGKPLLVLPRNPAFGELVDDHQTKTARCFAELGHLLTFENEQELAARLAELATFVPVPRRPNVRGVAEAIGGFLDTLADPPQGAERRPC